MAHRVAQFSKRHSNRLMAAAAKKKRDEGSMPITVQRTGDVSGQSVSVTVNSSGPVQVNVQVSPDHLGDPVPTLIDFEMDQENDQPSGCETDSDDSDNECDDRDLNLHVVHDHDLEEVDVTDCIVEEDKVEFVHLESEPAPVTELRQWALAKRVSRDALDTLLKTRNENHMVQSTRCVQRPF